MSIDAYTSLIYSGCPGRISKLRSASATGPLSVLPVSEAGYEKVNAAALDINWAQLLPFVSGDRPDKNNLVAAFLKVDATSQLKLSGHKTTSLRKLLGQPRGRQAQGAFQLLEAYAESMARSKQTAEGSIA